MSDAKKKSKKKGASKSGRTELRFVPGQMHMSMLAWLVGMPGGIALGTGVYGMWVSKSPPAYAPYLLAVGLMLLVGALAFGDADAAPVRVGDAGVGVEKGSEFLRVAWCDIKRLFAEKDELVVQGIEQTLRIPIPVHLEACSWILVEATRRVPDAVDVKREVSDRLPKPEEGQGEKVALQPVQLAGRRCAKSDKAIAFERDARVCPNCGQVYHREHVPAECVTCKEKLGERAFAISA
ncbi:MAG: hypothetical protein SFV15_15535 [Polyangiaceae bacterium]|nr:hypothetical protein [Polyangiaceae bacterium]